MDERFTNESRSVNPRRRPRSKVQIFKEAYLPVIITGIALLLILIFIIGSIVRAVQRKKYEQDVNLAVSASVAAEQERLTREAEELLFIAADYAEQFDYTAAIETLNSYSGDILKHDAISAKLVEYTAAQESMVLWNDPNQVLNLSFQMLIADPERAFKDAIYGSSYNQNFITTEEFSKILSQLYENNYILIRLSDITDGKSVKDLYLPSEKKPLILTQTQVNYNTYMVDSDGDKLPDAGGDGFASKLIIDENGNVICEMVDSTGETVTGNFDLVPILDAFVETHPDFSYKGAKAILAVTGYDGLFGYRTNASASGTFDLSEQTSKATEIFKALQANGYEIACYTYANIAYGVSTIDQIKEDINQWSAEISPILGDVDTLVFARNSDISTMSAAYSGEKFSVLQSLGFTNYLGFCTEGKPWFTAGSDHIRQGRLLVSGANLASHPDWFNGIFDAASVLDSTRNTPAA